MISFCTLARDTPDLDLLVAVFKRNCPCEYEICIGDNSTKKGYTKLYKELADVYVRIEDKELWRMGIPWGHNRVASMANSYKIFYVDSDEYPVWIHPEIEKMFDVSYIPLVLRYDFFPKDLIFAIEKEIKQASPIEVLPKWGATMKIDMVPQDRLYNARYVKFDGVCHSVFHAPSHFRGREPVVHLLHNKTVRDAKNIERMRQIIREQYSRMIINPTLSSSPTVLQWAKDWMKEVDGLHPFKSFEEFKEAFD